MVKDLLKGRRSRLANIFFKNYFCHVCHTRFVVFFAPLSFYVSSLLRASTTLTIQGRWNCAACGKLSVQLHVSPFVNGYRTLELFVCLNDRGTVEFKQIYKRVNIHLKERKWKWYSWFSHDVTKIQTKKLSLLLSFYLHVILEHLKTFTQINFRFKRVLCFAIQDAWISRLFRDAAFSWRPGKLLCGLKTLRIFGDFAI